MAKAKATVKKAKHNIKVTINELNQPSDEAIAEFNRLFNKFVAKLSIEKAALDKAV